jgi:hypothetical protein
MSEDAADLLARLRWWGLSRWLGIGRRGGPPPPPYTISKRAIHQRLRGYNRRRWRYVASLDGPLAELVAQGLLRQLDPPRPRGRGRPPGPVYELVPLQPSPPRRKPRAKKAEAPAQVEPAQAEVSATPPTTPQPTMDQEIAWRFARLWQLTQAHGGPSDLPVNALGFWRQPGCCQCCGDPLAPGDIAHCRPCLLAKLLVAKAWKAKRAAGG